MRVGFIGLGTMGASIALNAMKGGFALTVHDVRKAAADPHLKAGAAPSVHPVSAFHKWKALTADLPGPCSNSALVPIRTQDLLSCWYLGAALIAAGVAFR